MNEKQIENFTLYIELEKTFEWMRWKEEIPYLQFPANWKVKAIPPFVGAIIRYYITKEGLKENEYVSVYLDCYDILGCMEEPYWEIYPNKDGEASRYYLNNIDLLLKGIDSSLKTMEKRKINEL